MIVWWENFAAKTKSSTEQLIYYLELGPCGTDLVQQAGAWLNFHVRLENKFVASQLHSIVCQVSSSDVTKINFSEKLLSAPLGSPQQAHIKTIKDINDPASPSSSIKDQNYRLGIRLGRQFRVELAARLINAELLSYSSLCELSPGHSHVNQFSVR